MFFYSPLLPPIMALDSIQSEGHSQSIGSKRTGLGDNAHRQIEHDRRVQRQRRPLSALRTDDSEWGEQQSWATMDRTY